MRGVRVSLPHGFAPRSYQQEVWTAYNRGYRRFICVWHRKAGKDLTWLNFAITQMVKVRGMYWHVFPTYEQAKKTIWYGINPGSEFETDADGEEILDREGRPIGGQEGASMLSHFPDDLVARRNNSDLIVELKNGSMYQLIGSDKLEAVVGPNPVGIIYSEYSLQFPEAWIQVGQPILEQNRGWAAFIFTPRGRNHAFKLWENAQKNSEWWWASLKTVEETRRDAAGERGGYVVGPEQIERLRAEGVDEDYIQQEYYCSFYGAHTGSYYGKMIAQLQKDNQVRQVPHEPTLPVYTVWDLGVADATAIWFAQNVGREVHLIDYYEASGEGLPHFAKEVRSRPYVYSTHWAPHDIEVRELGTGVSRKEMALPLGINFRVVPNLPIQDGIDAARALLSRCFFDRTKCDLGLRALQNYSKEWNPKAGEYKSYPKHDKWSHGADAFRYLAIIAERENSVYVGNSGKCETEFDIFEGNGNAGTIL